MVTVLVAQVPGAAAASGWSKVKRTKAPAPSRTKAKAPAHAKAKADSPTLSGKVAVFGFKGEGAEQVQHAVVTTLRTRGLQVTTSLRPVDSAEQYRDMGAALQLAAYIDGKVGGSGARGQATLLVRSGVTGRRVASIRFAGDRSTLASDVGSGLWPRTGSKLTRLCAEAAKPRKQGRRTLRIDAGTPLENTTPDDSDIPAHLRNDRPDPRKEDPWADES